MATGADPKILIVGAGIAGLALARRFEQLGRRFTIIERRGASSHGGAAIALPFNALMAMEALGIRDAVLEQSHPVSQVIYAKPNGRVLNTADLTQAPLNRDRFVALRRAKLHSILQDQLATEIHYQSELVGLQTTAQGCEVETTERASSGHYDLVIAADGLHSKVRASVFPGEDTTIDHGIHNWRCVVDWPSHGLQPTYILGKTELFMLYPCAPNEVYLYAHEHESQATGLPLDDPHSALAQLFADHGPIVGEALSRARTQSWLHGRLQSVREPYFYRRRVAFVGDAANACSPLLQQGAAQALEDISSLARELVHTADIESALAAYRADREPRVRWVLERSDGPITMVAKMGSLPVRWLRNTLIRAKGPLNAVGWRDLATRAPQVRA